MTNKDDEYKRRENMDLNLVFLMNTKLSTCWLS